MKHIYNITKKLDMPTLVNAGLFLTMLNASAKVSKGYAAGDMYLMEKGHITAYGVAQVTPIVSQIER